MVRAGYERLYNIQNGDVWGSYILDLIAPVGKEPVQNNQGFSYHDEVKYKGKSKFLQDFYKGGKRPQF